MSRQRKNKPIKNRPVREKTEQQTSLRVFRTQFTIIQSRKNLHKERRTRLIRREFDKAEDLGTRKRIKRKKENSPEETKKQGDVSDETPPTRERTQEPNDDLQAKKKKKPTFPLSAK